jgi:transmembrane sensor
MEHRIPSRLNTQIYEEACQWFIECRAGELADAARSEFDRWLRKSPEHLSAYLEIAAIWNEGPSLDPAGKYDADRLVAEATQNQGNVVSLPPQAWAEEEHAVSRIADSGEAPYRWPMVLAAAMATVAVGAGALIWSLAFPGKGYSTAIGEQRSIELTDGSTLELNSLTRVRVHYTKEERDVELLQGQALFTVAKDPARPFIVASGATRVRAVGTEFDVYKKHYDTVLTVVEGRVAVLAGVSTFLGPRAPVVGPGQGQITGNPAATRSTIPSTLPFPESEAGREGSILVSAGEQLTVTPRALQLAPHADIASATAWTQRELIFHSASLTEVADEFNRYNDRKLIVTDSSLETFHISGVFSSTDPSSLIRFLQSRPGIRIVQTDGEIRVEKMSLSGN